MRASIIIPVYNQLPYFEQCVWSLKKYAKDCELIIIDNGSHRNTRNYIDTLNIDTLVRHKSNQGVAKAWNEGISVATSDKMLILNSDILIGEGFVEHMTAALDKALYVQPRFENKELVGDFYARAVEISQLQEEPKPTDILCGFAFGISRKTVKKIGLFDEDFLVYVDKDYVHRLKLKGYQQQEVPNALIHHYESRTLAEMQAQGFDWYDHDTKAWNEKWA